MEQKFLKTSQYSLTGIFLFGYIVFMKTTLNALAEPNRLHIVELLRDGPLTVGEIADRLGLNQPQTSKHLRVLSNAGLVEVNAIANRRIYKLRAEPFKELDSWLESYRHIWNERFDRLDDYLQDLQRKDVNHDDK
jgi:DNA-binding transcriptional ArsR family regulator